MPECRQCFQHFITHAFSHSNNFYEQAYPTKPLVPLYVLTQYEQLDITLYKQVEEHFQGHRLMRNGKEVKIY